MRAFVAKYLPVIAWGLGGFVLVSSIAAWWTGYSGKPLTPYDIFPPLGLVAFGLMWSHYVIGALRRYAGQTAAPRNVYMLLSMGVVLSLLLLHPGILWISLYIDGYGLPPQSYYEVYSAQLGLLAIGTVALIIFLTYELRRYFKFASWWKYIEKVQLLAMALIFVHAIGLGRELRIDWFMVIWLFYGVTLIVSAAYTSIWDNGKKGKI